MTRAFAALVLAITSLVMFGTITQTEAGSKARFVSYDVEVDRVFKGNVASEATVVTAAMSSTCGLPGLPEGEPLLFFANPEAAGLSVNSCGGTSEARAGNLKAVTAALGEPHQPTSSPDARSADDDDASLAPWLGGGALLAAAAVSGGVLLRERRSA